MESFESFERSGVAGRPLPYPQQSQNILNQKNQKNQRNGSGVNDFSKGTQSAFESVYLQHAQDTHKAQIEKNNANSNYIGDKHDFQVGHFGQHSSLNPTEFSAGMSQEMSLTGNPIDKENFTHNNMTPFFGSHVRQNLHDDAHQTRLETFTGVSSIQTPKEEVVNTRQLQRENIFGTQNFDDAVKDRYVPSKYKGQGVSLEKKVYVGPGLNQGYTSTPTGGFHQFDALQYAMPKQTDDLRVKTKPKVNYEGRVLPAFLGSRRGIQTDVEQNRVVRFHSYENEPRFNTTVVQTKKTLRPTIEPSTTSRTSTTTGYTGNAGPSVVKKQEKYSTYTPECVHKQNLPPTGFRNATTVETKEATVQYCSDIRNTQKETEQNYLGLVGNAFKRITAPIQDIMRATVRETTEEHGRPEGHVGGIARKTTMYDTDDVARTTLKETMIHDTRSGNIGAIGQRGTQYCDDVPVTTARQTLKQFVTELNLQGEKKIIRPDVNAPTTVRDTTLHTPQSGGVALGQIGQGYATNPKNAPPTARQFTTDYEYAGIAEGNEKGAYSVTKTTAPPTSRQFTTDTEYTGVAEGQSEPRSYQDIYNATINEVKNQVENVAKGRAPTNSNVSMGTGQNEIGFVEQKNPLEEPDSLKHHRITQTYVNPFENTVTNEKKTLCDTQYLDQRIDPQQLQAFQNNPFTKPLDSHA